MSLDYVPLAVALGLFAGMVLSLELGRLLRRRWHKRGEEDAPAGISVIDGALFALLGLLIAFTFSGAVNRFEDRRDLIREELTAIARVHDRFDLLPPARQAELRALLRDYLEARLDLYRADDGAGAAATATARIDALQGAIWSKSVEAAGEATFPQAPGLVLGAITEMFDAAVMRTVADQIHAPAVVYVMLALFAWIASLHAGFGMAGSGRRSLLHILTFSAAIALVVYVILDIEYPRRGLFRVDDAEQILLDLERIMAPSPQPASG